MSLEITTTLSRFPNRHVPCGSHDLLVIRVRLDQTELLGTIELVEFGCVDLAHLDVVVCNPHLVEILLDSFFREDLVEDDEQPWKVVTTFLKSVMESHAALVRKHVQFRIPLVVLTRIRERQQREGYYRQTR